MKLPLSRGLATACLVLPLLAGCDRDGESRIFLSAGKSNFEEEQLLPPEEAFKVTASFRESGMLIAELAPAKNHYLYKDKLSFALENPSGLLITDVRLPPGEVRNDEFYGTMEIYKQPVQAEISLNRVTHAKAVALLIRYQGCNEKLSVCYPPLQKSFDLSLP